MLIAISIYVNVGPVLIVLINFFSFRIQIYHSKSLSYINDLTVKFLCFNKSIS